MSADQDRLIRTATHEAKNHTEEAARLTKAAKLLLDAAEWHSQQAESWQTYAGTLITDSVVQVDFGAPEVPEQRPNLYLVPETGVE